MLYTMVQSVEFATLPARLMAQHTHMLLGHPIFRDIPGASAIAAACELLSHSVATHGRPDFCITHTTMRGTRIAVHEEVVGPRHPFCKLLHFRKDTVAVQPCVLVVAPLSGHFATLLRGTIETLLPDMDVYVTDWQNARDVPLIFGQFGMDDSIDVITECLRYLGEGAHVIAVCQPSVTVLAAVALLAENENGMLPRSMTLMGGPIDTRANPMAINRFAESHSEEWFAEHMISSVPLCFLGAFRRVYPGFLQLAGFLSMNLDRHTDAHKKMFDDLVRGEHGSAGATRAFYDEYTSVMDLTAEFYMDTVKRVFKEHQLPQGTFRYRGHIIKPEAIDRTATLVIEGERDDICGPGQTKAALPLLSGLPDSKKSHHLQKDVGHYAVFHGTRWNREIYPVLREFIATTEESK